MTESAGPYRESVTEERVERFAAATGFSPELRALLGVPPTYLTRYRAGEFALFEKLGISLSNILHAEQTYEYRAPIQVGDEIEYSTRLANIVDKNSNGRKTQFLTLETEVAATRAGQALGVVSIARTVVVVRGKSPEVA